MNEKTKKWSIVAAILVLVGGLLICGVMTALRWDFERISTVTYETNEHVVSDSWQNIYIEANTADIQLLPTQDGACRVVCYEEQTQKHAVEVKDGTLTIVVQNEREWHNYVMNFGTPKLTVYLPAGACGTLVMKTDTSDIEIAKEFSFASIGIEGSTGDVWCYASTTGEMKIKQSTGDICVENVQAGALALSVSTGRIAVSAASVAGEVRADVSTGRVRLDGVTCGSLASTGGTGDILLKRVIVAGEMKVERSTGDVELDASDAATILIRTSTGDVEGTLLSEKVFVVTTSTGEKEIPKTTSGGICEIETSTGDVEIDIIN